MNDYSIVIPTIGRPSLSALLASLERADGARAIPIVIVDDRTHAAEPIDLDGSSPAFRSRMRVVRSAGRGPASARNTGWRATTTSWVCFLDDDVIVERAWWRALERDLMRAHPQTAGVQARIEVPLPRDRGPSDWERNVAGLADSAWITADMVYRRQALEQVGGFDERFTRAYREDADLAIRVQLAGWTLERGTRRALHPVRPADRWISVRLQRGNADDALMRALHGPRWRALAAAPRGRFRHHLVTVAFAGIALVAGAARRRDVALSASLAWALATAAFAWRRIAPGPRTRDEVATMIATSAVIPFVAVYYKAAGVLRARLGQAA